MQMPSNWISTNSNSVPLSEAVKEKIKISKRRRKMNRFKHFRRSERWIPDLWASYTPFLHNQAFLPRDISLPSQEISELIAATHLQWQRASHSGSSPLVHWALGLYTQHNKPIWPNDPMGLGLSDGNWIPTNLWNIPLHNWPTYSPSVKWKWAPLFCVGFYTHQRHIKMWGYEKWNENDNIPTIQTIWLYLKLNLNYILKFNGRY